MIGMCTFVRNTLSVELSVRFLSWVPLKAPHCSRSNVRTENIARWP